MGAGNQQGQQYRDRYANEFPPPGVNMSNHTQVEDYYRNRYAGNQQGGQGYQHYYQQYVPAPAPPQASMLAATGPDGLLLPHQNHSQRYYERRYAGDYVPRGVNMSNQTQVEDYYRNRYAGNQQGGQQGGQGYQHYYQQYVPGPAPPQAAPQAAMLAAGG